MDYRYHRSSALDRLTTRQAWILFALAFAWAVAANCAHTPPNLSPQARTAFNADQVVVKLGQIQTTVIDANHTGGVPDRVEVPIVQFTVAALKTIRDVPNGWLATVQTGLAQLKAALSPDDLKTYAVYFLLIDTVLTTAGGAE